jgi:formylglycine-generating enzyme required for sulfatase activity
LSGNVWEWTRTLWGKDWSEPDFAYPYQPLDGREDLNAAPHNLRVLRGGSSFDSARDARCSYRVWYYPDVWCDDVGFRVVVSPYSSAL